MSQNPQPQPQPQISHAPGSTAVLDRDTALELNEPGDHDRFAHHVPKRLLAEAIVMGVPVRALCGKVWVPSRSPETFPVCPDCKAAWEKLPENKPDKP